MMHEQAHCHDEAANHQLPIAAAFWIIQIVSTEECSSLTQNLMLIHCSTCPSILNATDTQNTCSLNSIYRPHWLVQWKHHCSHMRILVYSPGLSGYIDVAQTVPVILTMAGIFSRQNSGEGYLKTFPVRFYHAGKCCKAITQMISPGHSHPY